MSEKSENYGSEYLYSEDLLHKQTYVTADVTIEEVIQPGTLTTKDKRKIDKWSLRFVGKSKILVLCKTNASILHHVIGDAPGPSWVGKSIKLQVRVVEAFGAQVTAIRVIPPTGCMIRKSLIQRLGTKAEWRGGVSV
jgi:hypothetical protein